jgi:hypothetical protein
MVSRPASDALDGLVFDVPDTSANDEEFGRGGNDQGRDPFPGGPSHRGGRMRHPRPCRCRPGPGGYREQTLATALISRLTPGMLVLADPNFSSYQAWQQASATGAALLWRVSGRLALPVLAALSAGSYRSLLINPKVHGRRRAMFTSRRGGW